MSEPAEKALAEIRGILWPKGDEDHDWSSDTLQDVAQVMENIGLGKPDAKAHVIPIAFEIFATSEQEAAYEANRILAAQALPDRYPELHSWWLPNHPEADGGDDEGHRLKWINLHDDEPA